MDAGGNERSQEDDRGAVGDCARTVNNGSMANDGATDG
jgi:hypothetical protein